MTKDFLLIYFESDNSFTVINDEKKKFIKSKNIRFDINKKWYNGTIKYRGIKEKTFKNIFIN